MVDFEIFKANILVINTDILSGYGSLVFVFSFPLEDSRVFFPPWDRGSCLASSRVVRVGPSWASLFSEDVLSP